MLDNGILVTVLEESTDIIEVSLRGWNLTGISSATSGVVLMPEARLEGRCSIHFGIMRDLAGVND